MRNVPASELAASMTPSGLNFTARIAMLACRPGIRPVWRPVCESQVRTVPSRPPETRVGPPARNCSAATGPECPRSTCSSRASRGSTLNAALRASSVGSVR